MPHLLQFCRLPMFSLLCLTITGCAMHQAGAPIVGAGQAIQGAVHGGQQPIVGAHIYLLAANTMAYGGPGIPASSTNAPSLS